MVVGDLVLFLFSTYVRMDALPVPNSKQRYLLGLSCISLALVVVAVCSGVEMWVIFEKRMKLDSCLGKMKCIISRGIILYILSLVRVAVSSV